MLLELLYSFFIRKNFLQQKLLLLLIFHCDLNLLQKKVFSNTFMSILSPALSNYDPWNSLLVCQYPNDPINKTIVLSNQQLVKFYKNNNLGLCGPQKFFKKLDLTWGSFFLKHPLDECSIGTSDNIEKILEAGSNVKQRQRCSWRFPKHFWAHAQWHWEIDIF